MRKDVMDYINQDQQLKEFIRQQPNWYRKLTRNPYDLQTLQIASLHYYKKTIPDQVNKFTNGVQMASMMMNMFMTMNSQG